MLGHTLACWYIFSIPYFLNIYHNISSFILKIHLFYHTCNIRDVQWNRNQEDVDKSVRTPKYHLCLHCHVYLKDQLYDLCHLRLKDK